MSGVGGVGMLGLNIDPVTTATPLPPLAAADTHQREVSSWIGTEPGVASISHKAAVGKVQLLGVGGTSVPRDRRPPRGSPRRFTSVSPAAVITALVFRLCCRQKALMGVARLQIPVPTFLIKSALSSRFILFHPSTHLAQCSHLRG